MVSKHDIIVVGYAFILRLAQFFSFPVLTNPSAALLRSVLQPGAAAHTAEWRAMNWEVANKEITDTLLATWFLSTENSYFKVINPHYSLALRAFNIFSHASDALPFSIGTILSTARTDRNKIITMKGNMGFIDDGNKIWMSGCWKNNVFLILFSYLYGQQWEIHEFT